MRRQRSLTARRGGQQRDVARLLDSLGGAALMGRTSPRQAARNDLAALGHKAGEQTHVLVIDAVDLLGAELADLLAPEELAAAIATATAGASAAGARSRGPGTGRTRGALGCRCFGPLWSCLFRTLVCHNSPCWRPG